MSLHIKDEAKIAKIVLMPGDPKRASFIATTYLENVELVSDIRGMTSYTGIYKGKEISIVPSGMGMPSMGIYAYELYNSYNVDVIIRIGTCGTFNLNVMDLVVAKEASTFSNFAKEYNNIDIKTTYPDQEILNKIKELNENIIEAKILTTDVFYKKDNEKEKVYDAIEMETFALFHIAKDLNKKASALFTVSDVIGTTNELTKEQREKSLTKMIETALNAAINI